MSGFNNLKFNLAPFNIEKIEGLVWLEGASITSFKFIFAGLDVFFHGNAAISITSNEPKIDKGRMFTGNTAVNFVSDANVLGHFNLTGKSEAVFGAILNLSQQVYAQGSSEEIIDIDANLSQEAYMEGFSVESFDVTKTTYSESGDLITGIVLSQAIYENANIGEVFQASADIIALSEIVCELPGVILKPGQVLIIDSGSYNVLLDGDNAIHLQSGDWLDNLSRSTVNILISGTNATKLSASVLYTERYL